MIIIETDDLCPESLYKFEKYWKPLKEKHPKMKLTAFVPAIWQGKKENDVSKSEAFKKFFEENKHWVEIQLHGYDHSKPPEYQRPIKDQQLSFCLSQEIMEEYIKNNKKFGFKACFYRMNQDTINILRYAEMDFYVQWWRIIPLKPTVNPDPFPLPFHQGPFIVSTHTSPPTEDNKDDIELVHEVIDKNLSWAEHQGAEYLTMGEYVARMMGI